MGCAGRCCGDLWAILETTPGWHATDTAETVEPQRVDGLAFRGGDVTGVDPRTYSELFYDLHRLVEQGR